MGVWGPPLEGVVTLLSSFYKGKTVFVTGHTGFKGAWMCLFLLAMGARVVGYALPPHEGSLFQLLHLNESMESVLGDIGDEEYLHQALLEADPDIVFHLAAQPLVSDSYRDPKATFITNIMGTVNVFEACKQLASIGAIVNVTTDKCYQNNDDQVQFVETDPLGGHDAYSASKACSEHVTYSYAQTVFNTKRVGVATARAGNVIGGGDFAVDRILPDIVKALKVESSIVLRCPSAIRPWQHVFDVE